MEEKAVLPNGETVFQCCATLTLIWLSGSALLSCQPVLKGAADVFGCLCRAKKRCRDGEHAALVPGLWHTGPPSPDSHFSSVSFSFPALTFLLGDFFLPCFPFVFVILHLYDFHFPCFSQAGTSTHTQHTQTHFFQRLISGVMTVWFGKNPNAPLFICVFFPPKYTDRMLYC